MRIRRHEAGRPARDKVAPHPRGMHGIADAGALGVFHLSDIKVHAALPTRLPGAGRRLHVAGAQGHRPRARGGCQLIAAAQ
jgi:hypothetical protein